MRHAWIREGFPLSILEVTLETFAFARRITYKNAVDDLVHTLFAILDGLAMAHLALSLVLLGHPVNF